MKSKALLHIFAVLILCGLGFAVYSNTFHVPFQFDDQIFIKENYVLRAFHKIPDLWRSTDTMKRWAGFLTLAWNYALSGDHATGYHLVNLGIHLLDALLVYWFVFLILSHPQIALWQKGRWFQNKGVIPFLAAGLFLAHPVQTESVTYISQRFTVLVVFFYLLAVCLYWKARVQNGRPGKVRLVIYILGVLMCAVLGFFTKENMITLPLTLLAMEIYFNPTGRRKWLLFWGGGGAVIVITAACAAYPLTFKHIFEAQIDEGITWGNYLLTQFRVLMTYLRLMVLPIHQNIDYDYRLSHSLFEIPTALSFLAICAFFAAAAGFFKKHRLISFGIVWFFVTISVEASFIPLRDVIFEHRLYLPSIGLFIFFLVGLGNLCAQKRSFVVINTILIVVFAGMAYQRNFVWQSQQSLWEDAIRKSPLKSRPYVNAGLAYYEQRKYDQVLEVLNRAIELDSRNCLIYMNRAETYKAMGRYEEAASDYKIAKRLNPGYSPVYYNWANLLFAQKRFEDAERFYSDAISLMGNYALAYFGKGNALKEQQKYDDAVASYKMAIEFGGPKPDLFNNLGNTYREMGQHEQALIHYSQAIALNPNLFEAYINRASMYTFQNAYDLAMADFSRAVELNPNSPLVYNNRGNVFASLEKWPQALDDYTKAIELGNIMQAYLNRAMVYEIQKEYRKAIADYTFLIDSNVQNGEFYFRRALCYEKLQETSNADRDFLKAQALGFPVTGQ